MTVAGVICLLFLASASVAVSDSCSDVDIWPFGAVDESRALICAKIYATPDCTCPFPLLFYVNSSVSDFRQEHTFSVRLLIYGTMQYKPL